jgi:excisionase family DNA binding protein
MAVLTMNNKLLTVDQVAEYMGVHRDTVYNLVRSGRLPALQLGGLKAGWRITEDDLREFIANGKSAMAAGVGPTDEAALAEFERGQSRELMEFEDGQAQRRRDFLQQQREGR